MNFETLFGFDPQNWPLAILAFLRVLSVLVFLPIFGNSATPIRVRILLGMVFTFAVWPLIERDLSSQQLLGHTSPANAFLISIREVFFGFAVGFSAKLILYAANIAAGVVGVNMGFQAAALVSPLFGGSDSVLSNFKNWIMLMILLAFNMHHYFIELIFQSFQDVPLSPSANATMLVSNMVDVTQTSFEMGMRIAAPLLAIQIITTFALGLLGRAIPQLNVFIVNFPLSFLLSMVILFFAMSSLVAYVSQQGLQHETLFTQRTLSTFAEGP